MKASLKWIGPGGVNVRGVGDFRQGDEKQVPVEVARTFLGHDGRPEPGWEVTFPAEPEPKPEPVLEEKKSKRPIVAGKEGE